MNSLTHKHRPQPTLYEVGAQATASAVSQAISVSIGKSVALVEFGSAFVTARIVIEFGVRDSTIGGRRIVGIVDPGLPGKLNGVRLRIIVCHHCMHSVHRAPHL